MALTLGILAAAAVVVILIILRLWFDITRWKG